MYRLHRSRILGQLWTPLKPALSLRPWAPARPRSTHRVGVVSGHLLWFLTVLAPRAGDLLTRKTEFLLMTGIDVQFLISEILDPVGYTIYPMFLHKKTDANRATGVPNKDPALEQERKDYVHVGWRMVSLLHFYCVAQECRATL